MLLKSGIVSDVFDKATRSRVMAAVRSKGNRSTEIRLLEALRRFAIKGWRRHYRILGTPDFAFPNQKVVVFLDGCFWHGCKKCANIPKTNSDYWISKIARNKKRDVRCRTELKARGWRVLRVWEHSLKNEKSVEVVISRLVLALGKNR